MNALLDYAASIVWTPIPADDFSTPCEQKRAVRRRKVPPFVTDEKPPGMSVLDQVLGRDQDIAEEVGDERAAVGTQGLDDDENSRGEASVTKKGFARGCGREKDADVDSDVSAGFRNNVTSPEMDNVGPDQVDINGAVKVMGIGRMDEVVTGDEAMESEGQYEGQCTREGSLEKKSVGCCNSDIEGEANGSSHIEYVKSVDPHTSSLGQEA